MKSCRIQKITVRLNEMENKAIREDADRKQISVSEYVRSLVRQKPYNGGTTTPPLESIINNQANEKRYKRKENGAT